MGVCKFISLQRMFLGLAEDLISNIAHGNGFAPRRRRGIKHKMVSTYEVLGVLRFVLQTDLACAKWHYHVLEWNGDLVVSSSIRYY